MMLSELLHWPYNHMTQPLLIQFNEKHFANTTLMLNGDSNVNKGWIK
jgi:hypothetical protein